MRVASVDNAGGGDGIDGCDNTWSADFAGLAVGVDIEVGFLLVGCRLMLLFVDTSMTGLAGFGRTDMVNNAGSQAGEFSAVSAGDAVAAASSLGVIGIV